MAGLTTEQYCTPVQEKAKPMLTVLKLRVAIPATDLTNSVILFERVKVMIAIALRHLYFEGDSPLSYV